MPWCPPAQGSDLMLCSKLPYPVAVHSGDSCVGMQPAPLPNCLVTATSLIFREHPKQTTITKTHFCCEHDWLQLMQHATTARGACKPCCQGLAETLQIHRTQQQCPQQTGLTLIDSTEIVSYRLF
jgi:hypothetical protein